jgi:hypothetical protein
VRGFTTLGKYKKVSAPTIRIDGFDLRSLHEAMAEPLYNQEETENHVFMNPVNWTEAGR